MKPWFTILLLSLLAACSSVKEESTEPPEVMYAQARDTLNKGSFTTAAKLYEQFLARYPYGTLSTQGELDLAYTYYRQLDMPAAIAACDRFSQAHPTHPSNDYALYLKGLAYFTVEEGLLTQLSQQDFTERDAQAMANAFEMFRQLVTRYPNSSYTGDARLRMNMLASNLAEHDLHIARYYFRRDAVVAAVNRAKNILENYPQAAQREEALAIMVAGYEALGLTTLRDDARRVLELNYPTSRWKAENYQVKTKKWGLF